MPFKGEVVRTVEIYHMVNSFFAFSFLGYLLECAVLTCEYRQPVVDRGFGHGPFCIIYGFGALGACRLLGRFSGNLTMLFFSSMVMATMMELVTAAVMIRLFGAFWWDYSRKRYNYRGIICLQSSIAWGFLGIFFFSFLDGAVDHMVSRIPGMVAPKLAVVLASVYFLDFIWCVHRRRRGQDEEEMIGRLRVL